MSKHIIFVGNPGSGKSTLLNCLLGEPVFESGVSYGSGLTYKLSWHFDGDMYFGDTPGLADIDMREQAAEAIAEALRQDGLYKIFFVMTTEAARIRPQDEALVKTVMAAIDDDIHVDIQVILNKVSQRTYDMIRCNEEACDEITDSLAGDRTMYRSGLYLFRFNDALEDEDNATVHLRTGHPFRKYIGAHDYDGWTFIEPCQVDDLDTDVFQGRIEELEWQVLQYEEELQDMREQFEEYANQASTQQASQNQSDGSGAAVAAFGTAAVGAVALLACTIQ